ncbi:HAMP domain-containing histidine kinase [Cellulophaga baltica]|uniref:sensor histidine kinase n=1 Tax=Cellulophaga TaxID=104264 RepID=UPI001C0726CA|nr:MULTISPECIES: HAMP domain-containing sensor histidine kinase [Cellulophaga]MBU2995579.1 HAMP domain-containing histidine kinase [Cellulophaga baltica]MDO6766973.1 HAMP domain-containing sensor histidine kinase [Cellulophaga sp. 1_MG-2023]
MNFNPEKKTTTIILQIASFAIVCLILWNTNSFFKKFKEEERNKVEIWASALVELQSLPADADPGNLPLKIFQNNTSTPMVLVNRDGAIKVSNMPKDAINDTALIEAKIRQFKAENTPIKIDHKGEDLATLYYGNSEVLNKLKFYPIALLLIMFLFGAVIYFFFKTNKSSEQNKLWAGMAKETAHQIGTPLTSLLGWNELLKAENINPSITSEIEKDITRLETITERFSKIGSLPILEELDIVTETKNAFDYLKRRSSKLILFSFESQITTLPVQLNKSLYQWTIENLVKNGIDAMRGKGCISIEILKEGNNAVVLVTDTGHGILKKDYTTIFNPGVTSKKRGWGLGLSLVKRIVEEYHKGKIRVLSSSKEGTIMKMSFKIN